VPLHSLDPEVVRALIRTFLEVFPDTCAWFINADMFLIGSDGPVAIDYDNARTCMARPELAAALKEAGLDDINEVLSCYAMGAKNLHDLAYAGEARYPVLRDDLPWAEFVAPRLMYLQTVQDSLKDFIPFFESPTTVLTFSRSAPAQQAEFTAALDRRSRARITGLDGLRQYYGGMIGSNPDIPFKKALDIDPNDQTAQYYVREIALTQAKAFLRWGDREKAVNQLEDALRYLPEQPALLGLLAEARK
jgi:spermidine synthase